VAYLGDILVVDDDGLLIDVIVSALQDAAYQVCAEYDGASALLAIQLQRPALVLLDLHLPGLTGQEVLADLRWRGLTEVPVVIMSADVQAIRVLAADFAAALLKPFTLDTLLACVAGYMPMSCIPA